MSQALQPLPASEERALLDLVRANGLDASQLECYMTRQQGSGRGTNPGGSFTRSFNIHYDLMLCEYCGNAFPQRVCPARVEALRGRLKLNG
jgi:hypothetical protein